MKKRGIHSIPGIENEVYFQQKSLNVDYSTRIENGQKISYHQYYNYRSLSGEYLSMTPAQFKKDEVYIGGYRYRKLQKECPEESKMFGGQKYWIYERLDREQARGNNFNADEFNVFKEDL